MLLSLYDLGTYHNILGGKKDSTIAVTYWSRNMKNPVYYNIMIIYNIFDKYAPAMLRN